MPDLLIRQAEVLQLRADRAEVRANCDIALRGNRIDAILPSGTLDPSQARTVIEADGQLAMPGFINTHAHVPMTLWRGLGEDVNIVSWFNDIIWQLEANLTPEDVYWGMQLGLLEMIEAGVTAVADHYWHMEYAARAVEQAGTRALLGQAMFSANGMRQIDAAAAFVKAWHGRANGRIRAIMAPHAPYTCDDDFLRASARMAERIGGSQRRVVEFGVKAPIHVLAYRRVLGAALRPLKISSSRIALSESVRRRIPNSWKCGAAKDGSRLMVRLELLDGTPDVALLLIESP